jgi:two-component system CheB/CheR fusion protein
MDFQMAKKTAPSQAAKRSRNPAKKSGTASEAANQPDKKQLSGALLNGDADTARMVELEPASQQDPAAEQPIAEQQGGETGQLNIGPEAVEQEITEDPESGEGAPFPVVGIGASAGGLEAFTDLLHALPANTGMAFVFVQHLDPKHISLLTELLARETSMPVREVTSGVLVEPDHVYIIPQNTFMTLKGSRLLLTQRNSKPGQYLPIDHFFRSIAAEQKTGSVGVVLSGTASDGAMGLRAIKAAGGITFAQDEESAKFNGMPRAAVAAGCVDFVMRPEEISKELSRLGGHPYVASATDTRTPARNFGTDHELAKILALIRIATGVDFSYYKTTTIRRRISRRMVLHRFESFVDYLSYIRSTPGEVQALYEDILINVTEFFRDPEAFQALSETVFPKIMEDKLRHAPIRIWVPGCATGEEVYTIAICLLEFLENRPNERTIQIFGTDISDVALEAARAGIYSEAIAQNVSQERLRRFFTKLESGYQIVKRIREMCVFAKHNLTKDPPFSKLDLVSCRNLLIYLAPVLQKRVIPIFHYSLCSPGFLLLGSSETIGSHAETFILVDKKHKIYVKNSSAGRVPLDLSHVESLVETPQVRKRLEDWSDADLQREADRIVLSKYGPSGVVIDEEMNIIQFRGRTSAYLEPAAGAASLNLVRMLREGPVVELRSALQTAKNENRAVRREGLHVQSESGTRAFHLEVIPIKRLPSKPKHYLVLFEDASVPSAAPKEPGANPQTRQHSSALERENAQLRQDLAVTREYLQSIIEEQESANEELRSANEEIQSSNEELQSTNEELETAKEELQSTNEELNTVNEELQNRNMQLAHTGNDLLNLLSNVHIPIVMLGSDLRIRRFTPICERALNLIPTDVGRPISDINFNFNLPNLLELLTGVIRDLEPKSIELRDNSGRSHSLRIRPYRTEDDRIDGVVMVLVDVETGRKYVDDLSPDQSAYRQTMAMLELESKGDREKLRKLAAGLIETQEEERRRVSRELHDELNQRLALLEMNIDRMQKKATSPKETQEYLRTFREAINALSLDLRRIAHNLHPAILDDLGLVVAVESYIEDLRMADGINVRFVHQDMPGSLPPSAAICAYRLVQEALRNVVKHAGVKQAHVSIQGHKSALEVVITDGGRGFDPNEVRSRGGLGLTGMAERVRLTGGTITVTSSFGKGARIEARIPFPEGRGESTPKR